MIKMDFKKKFGDNVKHNYLTMKKCLKCHKDFFKNNYAGRVTNICDQCHAKKQKEYRESNKEKIKQYQKEYRKKLKL